MKINAQYFLPAAEVRFPGVLVLFEAGCPFDAAFVRRFTSRGYGVLCVDYCGENGSAEHTVYPAAIDYANYVRAGSHLESASPSARETSWYEWACVARYAAKFLSSRPEVTRFGAVGLRTGGEVLFKIAPYAPLSCLISVCAAGWLLGGPVGLGTLLSVFGIGAAMQLVFALVRFEPRQVRHESLKDLWAAPGRRSRPAGTR